MSEQIETLTTGLVDPASTIGREMLAHFFSLPAATKSKEHDHDPRSRTSTEPGAAG